MKIVLNGKEIVIREFCPADSRRARDFQRFINSFVGEGAMLSVNKKKTLKDEREFLRDTLKAIRGRKKVMLLAEHEERIVGDVNVRLLAGRYSHVAMLGIGIINGYRGMGLGSTLMEQIIELAKNQLKRRPKFLRLSVFKNNLPAIALYRKLGFKAVAEVPGQLRYKGKLVNEIIMLMEVR